jgi:tetratricopeptide (TPR) repeat protein
MRGPQPGANNGIDSMTSSAASTRRHAVADHVSETRDASVEHAAQLVDQAEEILSRYLRAGRWPAARTARRFRESGDLQLVLSLYSRAMADDPSEPAYPWNLASSLDRLGLPDLALVFIRRAIRVAEEGDDRAWSGADAHLGWADIALRAGEPEIAEQAIKRAREVEPEIPVERYLRQLRRRQPAAGDGDGVRHDDAARKGVAVEYLIAASCMLASDFALNVSTSLVDDEGVDLVFHRREGSATLAVQIKSRSWAASIMRDRERFVADVRRATFHRRPDLFLLFVAVDARFADYGPVWLIPSVDFAQTVARSSGTKLRFVASASPASNDRWSRYRLERSELPDRILSVLSELERENA